jgi:hypothetical protein
MVILLVLEIFGESDYTLINSAELLETSGLPDGA